MVLRGSFQTKNKDNPDDFNVEEWPTFISAPEHLPSY